MCFCAPPRAVFPLVSRCAPARSRAHQTATGLIACCLVLGLGSASSAGEADPILEKRLAAGEFGPALDAAVADPNPLQRARALDRIAQAQRKIGDFEGALATTRRHSRPEDRARAGGEAVRDRSGAGGSSVADYTELIDLITNTVDPSSWEALGGIGTVRPYNNGVYVDPYGRLRQSPRRAASGALQNLAARARMADVSPDMRQRTPLRVVSLRRLESAVAARLARGASVPESMRYLAGLTRLKYVFFVPEEGDILLAGPAQGWTLQTDGRVVASQGGSPILQLDDLVVVLRAVANDDGGTFGCSINTRDENLRRLRDFVESSNSAGPLAPGELRGWLRELHERLGVQDVVFHGVPADSRVARVLVEADYRMKLIGVGQIDGGPGIPSYFELLRQLKGARGLPLEALRWWLTMRLEGVAHDPAHEAFEFLGGSVLVQSENQFINAGGQHVPTGAAEPVNRTFAENFSRGYDELANRDPVFAELRNVFDLALAAALCRDEGLAERAGWDLGVFAPTGAYQPDRVSAPRVVDSVVSHRTFGKGEVVVQVAGGVQLELRKLLSRRVSRSESPRARAGQPGGRWWWNAANP